VTGGPADPASVRVRVPGKVNLALRVGPRRPDGFHPLATVFMALSVTDEVTARSAPPGTLECAVTGEGANLVGSGLNNLAVRAADLLRARHGTPDLGAALAIDKRIPVAGGMAGGSADAAGALVACARLWGLDIGPADLLELAGELGSDVPFPLVGGCALGLGRGEQVTPILCRGSFHWVLAYGAQGLSTAAVFRRFDERVTPAATPEVPAELMNALAAGDARALGAHLVNDLAPAALSLAPNLGRTIGAGRELGALGAVVSGSGPTVAFLAADAQRATDLLVGLTAEGVARRVHQAHGPVPGASVV
jgi:4-diphosphocytidyl-2-C-methyl-D-erythritol kinase